MVKYVAKFGGKFLKDADGMRKAADIVTHLHNQEKPKQIVAVISAQGKIDDSPTGDKVTNLLERIVYDKSTSKGNEERKEIMRRAGETCRGLGVPVPRIFRDVSRVYSSTSEQGYSRGVSLGDRGSSQIFGRYLGKTLEVTTLDFNEFGMTTKAYKEAEATTEATIEIERILGGKKGIVVVPGFVGYNGNKVTTLGRDGSNYSATKIGEAILADKVFIFSDEPGVRRVPPNLVPDAEIIQQMSYAEAIEFAELGAKIINPRAIVPARNQNIPIMFADENFEGTLVTSGVSFEHQGAKIITASPSHSIISVEYDSDMPGVLADVATRFSESGINIESIADERHSLSLAFSDLNGGDLNELVRGLSKKYKLSLENGFARVSVIGEGMRSQEGLFGRISSAVGRRGVSIEMVSQALRQLNISIYVPQEYSRIAVREIYQELFTKD